MLGYLNTHVRPGLPLFTVLSADMNSGPLSTAAFYVFHPRHMSPGVNGKRHNHRFITAGSNYPAYSLEFEPVNWMVEPQDAPRLREPS